MTAQTSAARKSQVTQERKYKCAYCVSAFSRSEHRSRHERSHTKERPFKCLKCRSTFVRRDLLLRHDRTVHAKDGGVPLPNEGRRRPAKTPVQKPTIKVEQSNLDQLDHPFDLETAAVLMTELHHAAAAILDQEQEQAMEEAAKREMSADAMYDGPVSYPSGALPVSNMTSWDPPTPCTERGSSLQPPSHGLMSRSLSVDRRSVTPSMHSGLSTNATPTTYSPYPYGPSSPSYGPASSFGPGAVVPPSPPQIESDEERTRILDNIKEIDVEKAVLNKFRLPSKSALNRYLSAYFNLFHHHLPFLHQVTFAPATVAAPLLLAVLSIGALYTFEKEQAFTLHLSSKVLVNNFLHRNQEFSSRNCPLWTTQASLLNMVFASYSGEAKGLEWACSIKSLVANLVAGGKYELQRRFEQRGEVPPTREEWIEDEGAKRTFFAVYVFFGMLTLMYNHTPVISYNEFDAIYLPCSETLWSLDASDEQTWQEQLGMAAMPTFKEAHSQLFKGETPRYSAFAARIMINALFLEVWVVKRSPDIVDSVAAEYHEKLTTSLEAWNKSLDLCTSEAMIVSLTAPQKGHPLIFNAMAIYRAAAARLEVDIIPLQEALRYHVPEEIAQVMHDAATSSITRSPAMTKVIKHCFECFQTPALMGIRWVARTSALNWSVEQPICGFDLMLILSLWLYRMEEEAEEFPPTEEEAKMLTEVRSLFDDDSVELYGSRLSAAVARIWGSMIDETVVWGITKVMGESFKQHSHLLAIEENLGMTPTAASTPSSSPGAEDDDEEMSDNE